MLNRLRPPGKLKYFAGYNIYELAKLFFVVYRIVVENQAESVGSCYIFKRYEKQLKIAGKPIHEAALLADLSFPCHTKIPETVSLYFDL